MFDPGTIATIFATFLLAGIVKGAVGLGLAPVCLGLLTASLDLHVAMVLLIVPSLVTNIWQAATGGRGRSIVIRIWPFLLMATASVWVGATALTRLDLAALSTVLGALLASYAALNLMGIRFTISARRDTWAGPVFGAANGILTGMTGSFVVPGVMYLQAIGLPRDMLVQAMGVLFTVSTIALALVLQANSIVTAPLAVASVVAVVPVMIGVVVGQRVRSSLSEKCFRRVFFISTLVLGAYIMISTASQAV